MKDADNQKSGNSQDQSSGRFSQVVHEMTEFFMNPPFLITSIEYKIIWFLVRELMGWKTERKPLSVADFVASTGVAKQHIYPALDSLEKKGILIREKLKGLRSHSMYEFNKDTFSRVLPGESDLKAWNVGSKVVDLKTFKITKLTKEVTTRVTSVGTLRVTGHDTLRNRRTAPGAASGMPKQILSNKIKNISLSQFQNFLDSQPRATKSRWERFISETLAKNPGDHNALLLAIERVNSTKKDLFGAPIQRSVIGLFENTPWEMMRNIFIKVIKEEDEAKKRAQKAEEEKKLLEELRQQQALNSEEAIDTSKLTPIFRGFAERNTGKQ